MSNADSRLIAIQALLGDPEEVVGKNSYFEIGKIYFIRTKTYANVGRVNRLVDEGVVLEEASWIPDSGQWSVALVECKFYRVEAFPKDSHVLVPHVNIIDAVELKSLPKE